LSKVLPNFFDIEHLLTKFVYKQYDDGSIKSARSTISNVICLKMSLKSIQPLSDILFSYKSELFKAMNSTLQHENIRILIDGIIFIKIRN
jgi:hypothetical protein